MDIKITKIHKLLTMPNGFLTIVGKFLANAFIKSTKRMS